MHDDDFFADLAMFRDGPVPEAGPELVTPMVTYLASDRCTVNGEAFSAGAGRYSRVFIGVTEGWLGPKSQPIAAEDIAAHLVDIRDDSRFTIPESVWDELRTIGLTVAERDVHREAPPS